MSRAPKPLRDRLMSKVQKTPSGCWIWIAGTGRNGYGRIEVAGEQVSAHRAAYTAFRGPIPAGLRVTHLCGVRLCINPDHLEPVTPREIFRRRGEHARPAG